MAEAAAVVDPYEAAENAWRFNLAKYAHIRSGGSWLPYPHCRVLADFVERIALMPDGRGIVNMPPRHGKSETCSKYLPAWFLEWDPTSRVIEASYGDRLATKAGRAVRDILRKAEDAWAIVEPENDAANDWATTAGGGMLSTGVGGVITGTGGDLIIVDDPHKNWLEAQSKTYRERVIEWFSSDVYTRREPGASIIVIMTRWHPTDLTGYLMDEHSDDWEQLCMPAIAEEDDDAIGRKEGDALCPWRFDEKALVGEDGEGGTKRGVGSRIWAGTFQQRPSPPGGNIIKEDWVRTWDKFDPRRATFVQSWDMAFKDTGTSRVVGQLWARKGADWYLIDRICGKWDYPATEREVREHAKPRPSDSLWFWHKARRKLVEDKANGPAIIASLKSSIPGLIPVNPQGNKEARLAAVSPLFEAGNVYLPHQSIRPWADEVKTEITSYPNSPFDDDTDCCSQVLQRASSAIKVLQSLTRY